MDKNNSVAKTCESRTLRLRAHGVGMPQQSLLHGLELAPCCGDPLLDSTEPLGRRAPLKSVLLTGASGLLPIGVAWPW